MRSSAALAEGDGTASAPRHATATPVLQFAPAKSPAASRLHLASPRILKTATEVHAGRPPHNGAPPGGFSACNTKELRVSFTPGIRSSALSAKSA